MNDESHQGSQKTTEMPFKVNGDLFQHMMIAHDLWCLPECRKRNEEKVKNLMGVSFMKEQKKI